MAIIYTYPIKVTPASGDDLIIISDSENENITKQIRVSQLPGGSSAGVTSIIQGSGITISSTGAGGTGNVTISAGAGNVGGTGTFNTLTKWNSAGTGIEDSIASQSTDGSIFTIKSGDNADPSLKTPILRIQNTSDSTAWASGDIVGALEFYNTDSNRLNAYIRNINQVGPSSANGGLTFGGSQYDAGLVGNINLVELGSLVPDTRIIDGLSTGYGTIFTVNVGPGDDSRLFVPKIRTQINWQGDWIPYQKLSEIQFFSNESGTASDRVEAYIHVDNGSTNGATPQGEISFGTSPSEPGADGNAKEAVRIQGDGTTVFERNLPLTITTTGAPSATLAASQLREMTSTTGAGLKALVNNTSTGTMYVQQIGNGRYVNGEAITPTTPFLDGNGNSVTGLTFTVQTNASRGSIKVQGDLFDKNDSTGTAGQVLSSTGTGNGVDWIDFNGGGSVTEVDAGIGLLTNPSSGITTTGSVSLRYVQTNEPTVSNFIDAATEQTSPQTEDYIIYSDQTGANQVYKAQIAELPFNNYVLPPAASGTRGGIKIGYPENGQNYPVELANEQAYVNVPWTAGSYLLPNATASNLGGVKIGFPKNQSARNYPLEITTTGTVDQAFVNIDVMTAATAGTGGLPGLVPSSVAGDQLKFLRGDATWATISTSNSGIVGITASSKATGPEITFNGTGVSQSGNTFTFSGGGVDSVVTTPGTFIDLTPTTAATGAVTVTADLSASGTAGTTTFLRGDNSWATPSGSVSGTYLTLPLYTQNANPSQTLGDSALRQDNVNSSSSPKYMVVDGAYTDQQWNAANAGAFKIWTGVASESYIDTAVLSLYQANTWVQEPSSEATFISFFSSATSAFSTANVNGRILASSSSSVGFGVGSDYRLKQNIKDYKKGLHNISNLRPVTYQMKSHPDETLRGFIAHEVEDYIPSAVQGIKDGVDKNGEDIMQTLIKGEFITDIVSAIKELKNEVDSLRAEIKSLQK